MLGRLRRNGVIYAGCLFSSLIVMRMVVGSVCSISAEPEMNEIILAPIDAKALTALAVEEKIESESD